MAFIIVGVFWVCLNPCCNGIWSRTGLTIRNVHYIAGVLILVVMEYGLGQWGRNRIRRWRSVLILVVMEYGLGLCSYRQIEDLATCLNPCCNGIWSRTLSYSFTFFGRFSVLILVVMEYGLGHCCICWQANPSGLVLILVVMEYGLGHVELYWNAAHIAS